VFFVWSPLLEAAYPHSCYCLRVSRLSNSV